MWRFVALCSVVGCFHPSPATGIPCSEGLHCPGDQVCDTAQQPPICVDHLSDAGADAVDAPGDDAMDAPEVSGCAADSDCAAGVCHELTGQCIPDAQVLFVTAGGIDNASCTRAQPCASPSNAASHLTAARRTISIADGTYSGSLLQIRTNGPSGGNGPLLISGSHRGWDGAVLKMAISIDGLDTTIEGVTVQSASQYGVQNKNVSTLSHVLISTAADDCITQRGGTLAVLDSKLDSCTQLGINATSEIDVERTIITNNKGGGVGVAGRGTIVNSVIAKNGMGLAGTGVGGVALVPNIPGSIVFRFNTVAGNIANGQVASGVECSTPGALIEDSIISGNQNLLAPQIGMGCAAAYSLFDANAPSGTGNLNGAPLFVNPPSDYHLQSGSTAIDKADPAATEPIDFEGGHRPTGAARDIGADETP